MKSPWHRDTHGASNALRFNGLLAAAPAEGHQPGLPMHARWNQTHPTHAAQPARRGARQAAWKPRLAGLLAAGALVLGVLAAGSDTFSANETGGAGSYSRSTLAPITASRADVAGARARVGGGGGSGGGSCRHRHKAGRFAPPKTVL